MACGAVTASACGVVGGRFELDRESSVVVAAVRADVMRQLHLVAVRTLLEIRQFDREMRATLALAGMRDASLGYTHGVVALLFGVIAGRDALAGCGSLDRGDDGCRGRRRSLARIASPCQASFPRKPRRTSMRGSIASSG